MENVLNMKHSQKEMLLQQMMKEVRLSRISVICYVFEGNIENVMCEQYKSQSHCCSTHMQFLGRLAKPHERLLDPLYGPGGSTIILQRF